ALRVDHGYEAHDRAHQHHALEPQVHDAGALADHLGDRRVEQRRAGEEGARQETPNRPDHRASAREPRATNRITANRTFTTAPGRACVICRMSPPAVTTASRNDAARMPAGRPAAIQLMRKPV